MNAGEPTGILGLKDINTRRIFLDFLTKGYFPETLPHIFSTQKFAEFVQGYNHCEYLAKGYNRGARIRSSFFSSTKRTGQRRIFSLLHPNSIVDISAFLALHWNDISTHIEKSTYTLSKPELRQESDRAVSIKSHGDLSAAVFNKMAPYPFIVRTDISRFYPSIYTHSVPWSIHGKEEAKKDHKRDSRTIWLNELDFLLRSSQEGQTIGLPVGADTSRVIAEMVAVAIDLDFRSRTTDDVELIRHVDDVWIGAQTYEQAGKYLQLYRESLREFELDINELKTVITSFEKQIDADWPFTIGRAIREDFERSKEEDRIRILEKFLRSAVDENDGAVLKYSIRCFDTEKLWDRHWEILESFLIHCANGFSHTIDYVTNIFVWRIRRGGNFSKAKVERFLRGFLFRHSSMGHDSEVVWGLWLLKEIGVRPDSSLQSAIIRSCGPVPIVMLLSYSDMSNEIDIEDRHVWARKLGDEPMEGAFWIVAYEAIVNKWTSSRPIAFSSNTRMLEEMSLKGISFIDFNAHPKVYINKEWVDLENSDFAIGDSSGRYETSDRGDDNESDDGYNQDF
ncbi:Reverse transcriptase family protein [Roseomonas mucosa]|uniref:Reverse transcriptase family protein n=2 Tax=Roseomonas mucosa TaxID=207340 RepID=A0A4Y1MS12_9PROT|nr:RNA-directed DNA polymerase [Roseomonas mucosa]AWV20771.1 Reverse transcriptase family protein [Roseomonas mucosa]MDT8356178.1 RNA-directed DNA polymerase [Roseomonas mucosa]